VRQQAIVVLGCSVRLDEWGVLAGALGRRVQAAADAYERQGGRGAIVVASGGRRWAGVVEADAMARELVRRGVPEGSIVRERCSLSTRQNARFAAQVLARRGIGRAAVVTCAWHAPRAASLFRMHGVSVDLVPVAPAHAPLRSRFWRWGRERVLAWVQVRGPEAHPSR
jgi:uncharacterized SAM-binding protein YcdF (DUF218 family)